MKLIIKIFLLLVFLINVGSCAVSPIVGPISSTKWGGQVVDNSISSEKKGEACARYFLGMSFGDASIETARKNAGITKIAIVDHISRNFIIVGEFCTVVYGQ